MISRSVSRAFTLIELLVVCAIMIVVTAIVLANNNVYGGVVLLQNFAYDLALSIREAQVYGISVERFGTGASSNFNAGYGVHFAINDPTHYELFADLAGTGVYQSNGNVSPSPYTINRGYSIYELCAPAGTVAAGQFCEGGTVVSTLDIVFVRPEPDAWINATCTPSSDGSESCANGQPNARIVLQSPRGDKMSVSVQANGQIAVDQSTDITP